MYYLENVLSAINELIGMGVRLVNTKKIRRVLDLDSSEKSKIYFIWRYLEILEEKGYLELYQETPSRMYRLPENKIQIEV